MVRPYKLPKWNLERCATNSRIMNGRPSGRCCRTRREACLVWTLPRARRARLAETFKIDFDCTFRVFLGHNRSERQQSDAEVAVRARREEIAAHRCRRPDGRPADRSGDRSEKGKGRRFGNSRHRHAGAKLYHVVADLDLLKLRREQAHIRPDRVTPSLTRRTSSVPSLAAAPLPVQPGTGMPPADY